MIGKNVANVSVGGGVEDGWMAVAGNRAGIVSRAASKHTVARKGMVWRTIVPRFLEGVGGVENAAQATS